MSKCIELPNGNKLWEVKVIATATHYASIVAKDEKEAKKRTLELVFHAEDASSEKVKIDSVTEDFIKDE